MSEANMEVVRRHFAAYMAGDQAAAEGLVAEDFIFSSPQDDQIDRATFFERCFPTHDRFAWQELKEMAATGDQVFVMYEYQLRASGERYRNTELLMLRHGQIVQAQVFFGPRSART